MRCLQLGEWPGAPGGVLLGACRAAASSKTDDTGRPRALARGSFPFRLMMVLADNFRPYEHSGWAKAGWTLFVIFLPLLGVLVYMIARPPEDVNDVEHALERIDE